MLPFGVIIPATVPQGSEIPEGLMNYPVIILQNVTAFKMSYSGYKLKGKGKVHPCTGTEALYRPYSP
jgi:hypothetical protein